MSLTAYKERKEKKFKENARLIRQYKKAVKSEGYDNTRSSAAQLSNHHRDDDDRKESTGRRNMSAVGDDERNTITDMESQLEGDKHQTNSKHQRKRPVRPDPFAKARQLAEEKERQSEEAEAARQERQRQLQKRELERKKRSKALSQRTRKGQPVMKSIIKEILEKLQGEKQEQES